MQVVDSAAVVQALALQVWLQLGEAEGGDEAGDANSPGVLDAYGKRSLWRGSATDPAWKPTVVVMDYVNFPLGYATNFVGLDFYQTYAM